MEARLRSYTHMFNYNTVPETLYSYTHTHILIHSHTCTHTLDICSVVDISYQSVKLDLLKDYLGGLNDSSLSELTTSRGWQIVTREDGVKMVEIRKQEATIKPKKILAKIDFDSESL